MQTKITGQKSHLWATKHIAYELCIKSSTSLGTLIAIMINLQPSSLKDYLAAAFTQSSQRQLWLSGNKPRLCVFVQPSAHNYNQDEWEKLLWFFCFPKEGLSRDHTCTSAIHYSRSTAGQKTVVINDPRLPPVNAVTVKKRVQNYTWNYLKNIDQKALLP